MGERGEINVKDGGRREKIRVEIDGDDHEKLKSRYKSQ